MVNRVLWGFSVAKLCKRTAEVARSNAQRACWGLLRDQTRRRWLRLQRLRQQFTSASRIERAMQRLDVIVRRVRR